jgi:hypothetical protein
VVAATAQVTGVGFLAEGCVEAVPLAGEGWETADAAAAVPRVVGVAAPGEAGLAVAARASVAAARASAEAARALAAEARASAVAARGSVEAATVVHQEKEDVTAVPGRPRTVARRGRLLPPPGSR